MEVQNQVGRSLRGNLATLTEWLLCGVQVMLVVDWPLLMFAAVMSSIQPAERVARQTLPPASE